MARDVLENAVTLKSIIDTAIDGIITIDQYGHIELINQAALNIFGYQHHEVIGKNIMMLMPEPDRSQHDGYIKRYQSTKKAHIIGIGREVLGLKKNGQTFPFRLAVSEVKLANRIVYTGIIHDLSEVKESREALLKLNQELENKVSERTDELEKVVNRLLATNHELEMSREKLQVALAKEKELNELKSRFVSMASHEFRTPLSTIMSSMSLIKKYLETNNIQRTEKHINRVQSSVNILTGILNDFLSLSKLEEGKMKLNLEKVRFVDLCLETIDEMKGILRENQEIIHEQEGEERLLNIDKRIIKNILYNLISNAIKYSKKGAKIKCTIRFNESDYSIIVKDEGLGIPENEQKYLFERFFRASNVENIKGTGLGLNIVKRYVDLLEGSIGMHSQEGVGSTFTVTIPY